jgi:hypothetical protein
MPRSSDESECAIFYHASVWSGRPILMLLRNFIVPSFRAQTNLDEYYNKTPILFDTEANEKSIFERAAKREEDP